MAEQKHTQDPLDMEEALSTSEAFLIKYKGRILGTIAAVVIIIAGFMGYKHFISDPNEVKASEALFKGEQYFGADNFETALNGDSIGYKGFLKVADEFSGTAAGNLANAYAGICYAQLGKYEDAVKYLDKFSAKDQLPIYLIQAGQLFEKLGKNSEAVKAYTLVKEKYFNSYQSMDIDKYIERASIK